MIRLHPFWASPDKSEAFTWGNSSGIHILVSFFWFSVFSFLCFFSSVFNFLKNRRAIFVTCVTLARRGNPNNRGVSVRRA